MQDDYDPKGRLNIPKTIRVGFQNRTDTYTGKLAYVIYLDDKDKPHKEKSWSGWRDHKIAPIDHTNEPTAGFVLNKDVGGTQRSWSWNARREKVRVYDPRDFEFEISVENLLFILQECSAIKGKGLEGEFVYAWSGSELVLVPVSSSEYQKSVEFCTLQKEKVSAKEVIPGCTYLTKDKKEVMYLGRFPWFDYKTISYKNRIVTGQKQHIFVYVNQTKDMKGRLKYWVQSGFAKLGRVINDKPIPQFADEFEALNNSGFISTPVKLVLSDREVAESRLKNYYNTVCVVVGEKYYIGSVQEDSGWGAKEKTYQVRCDTEASVVDGVYRESNTTSWNEKPHYLKSKLTLDEVKAIARELYIECDNGSKYKVGGQYE